MSPGHARRAFECPMFVLPEADPKRVRPRGSPQRALPGPPTRWVAEGSAGSVRLHVSTEPGGTRVRQGGANHRSWDNPFGAVNRCSPVLV